MAQWTVSATMAMAIRAFSGCWPLNWMGAPPMIPCSLANAITEPENVTAPMAAPRLISIRLTAGISHVCMSFSRLAATLPPPDDSNTLPVPVLAAASSSSSRASSRSCVCWWKMTTRLSQTSTPPKT